MLFSWPGENVERNQRDYVMQMEIIRTPELDQIRPRSLVILLRAHPLVLFVTRKHEIFRELCAHKPLMIVCSRVDQVAECFFATPSVCGFLSCLFGGERIEPRSRISNGLLEISKKLTIRNGFWGDGNHFSHRPRILSKL